MRGPLPLAVSLACAAMATLPAQAQTADTPAVLSNVVVTASGTAVDIREAPASISVITREDIERKPVTSIGELLSTVPGVTGGLSGTGAQSKIRLRGLPEKYTLILVDGKRQGNSAAVNYRDDLGQQDLDWISPEMIERIEVVRGPMSSLYGSDAMGGVINIITRKIAKKWSGSSTLNYSQPSDSERGDTRQLGFNISGPLSDKFGLRLGGNYTERASDEGNGGFPGAYQSTAGQRKQNFNALLNWQLTPDQTIGVEAGQGTQRATGSNRRLANGNQAIAQWGLSNLEHSNFGVSHEGRWGDVRSRLNLVHNKYEDKNDTIGNHSSETALDGRVDLPLKLFGLDQALTLGGQWKREQLDNRDTIGLAPIDYAGNPVTSSALSASTWALFGEDQIFLREDLALTLGLRMDHHQKYGNNWSPRAYLVYHPQPEWTVRGGVSRGFRAPGLKENSPSAATQSGGNGCRSLAGMGWPSGSINGGQSQPAARDQHQLRAGHELGPQRLVAGHHLLPHQLQEQDRLPAAGPVQRLLVDAHGQRPERAHARPGRQLQRAAGQEYRVEHQRHQDAGVQEPDHRRFLARGAQAHGVFVASMAAAGRVDGGPEPAPHRQGTGDHRHGHQLRQGLYDVRPFDQLPPERHADAARRRGERQRQADA
jgi:outer membrane receptor for ferrienterochelin and colicin